MDKKNTNRTHIICNIIMAVLLVLPLARSTYDRKKSEQQVDRAERISAEMKQQVDRTEEIYGRYTEALNRNTASNEELILILEQMNHEDGGGCAQ